MRDFCQWHKIKGEVDQHVHRVYFHEKEVWWCSVGLNIGVEQNGKGKNFSRPVLVFKKFNNEACWAIPVSKMNKKGRFYKPVLLNDGVNRNVNLSQLRLIDAKRLIDKLGAITADNYMEIQKAVINLCGQ